MATTAPDDARAAIDRVERWYHRIEVAPGVVTPGVHDSPAVLGALPFPDDLSGQTVLDIGTRDGFFAFEAERRGARQVVALDFFPPEETGFYTARRLLGSTVEFVSGNVYELSPERYGTFDVVLFLGVLYHLRNPMLALDRIRSVCTGCLVVETQVMADAERHADAPLARFYPGADLKGDASNWWAPNEACLRAMLEATCFDVVSLDSVSPERGAALAVVADDPERRYWQRLDYSSDARLAKR